MLHEYLFFGIVFFQLLFTAIQWATFRRPEYGFYILYILCISTYFLLKYLPANGEYLSIGSFTFNKLIPDRSLSFLAFGMYIKFGRNFLGTRSTPSLNKWLVYLENGIIAYTCINFVFVATTKDFKTESYAFAFAFGIAFVLSVIMLIRLYQNNRYSKYLIIGSSMAALGGCLALYLGITQPGLGIGKNETTIYLQAGVIADFIFLNIGLVVKTQLLQTKELEKTKAIELERLRISSELHDDLGGGLSTIRLMSEMMKDKADDTNISKQLGKISDSSKELVQKMNEIVWALNVNNDNLQSLVIYIRQYTVKFLDDIDIVCNINIPEQIPQLKVTGNNRRNIFLVVKEALNNIVKHAGACEVKLTMFFDDELHVLIHDNGKGISEMKINNPGGNGLANMCKRMRQLNSHLEILNSQGTTIAFSISLQSLSHESVIE